MAEKTKGARVAHALRKLAATGTVAGYVSSDDEHSQTHNTSDPNIQWVDIDLIKDSLYQHEEQIDPQKFESLVVSIRQEGLWHAFNVMEDSAQPGTYILTNGMHQRRKAAKVAGLTRVPIFIGPVLDQKRLAIRAARENMTDVNRSRVNLGNLFVQMGEQLDMSQEEIATDIGQSREFVKLCVMAAKSPPDIQRMVFEKPDSIRAMTYLRRIKPHITSEEESTINPVERSLREADAATLRAPIIARFLNGDLSTDGVLAEVEKVLASQQEQEKPMDIPTSDGEVIADPVASVDREEQEVSAPSSDLPIVTVSSSASSQKEVLSSERIGQARAALSRLKTYQRNLGEDAIVGVERQIIEEAELIIHQLLGREVSAEMS